MEKKHNIALIEPFYGGSHKYWIDGLIENLDFNFFTFTLPARHWKWRMEAGAISLAYKINQQKTEFDLFVVSDMLNVALFKSLLIDKYKKTKLILYFHENQLSYPWSKEDNDVKLKRDKHYQFINYTSALVADQICFNSNYNKNSFLEALPNFLKQFPGDVHLNTVARIESKCQVLPLVFKSEQYKKSSNAPNKLPVILWNHRWEFDKNPELFFNTLFDLKSEGIKFRLIVSGENYKRVPEIFDTARKKLKDEIIHFGFVYKREKYLEFLKVADILPVSSNQEFFGISSIEAILANTFPLLPDRLAYTEHIPSSLKDDFLYANDTLLKLKLKELLTIGKDQEKLTQLIDYINEQYGWNKLKLKYAKVFKDAIEK